MLRYTRGGKLSKLIMLLTQKQVSYVSVLHALSLGKSVAGNGSGVIEK